MKRKETASQVKGINNILAAVGVREINGEIAETPEKLPERSKNGRQNRPGIISALQNILKNNYYSIR